MATAQITDNTGTGGAVFYPAVYTEYASILRNGGIYLIKGKIRDSKLVTEQVFVFE